MSILKPLIVLGIILTASGFMSDILSEYVGPLEYKGYLVFDYPEGDNPIISIVFTIDPTLADNLIIVNVPSVWSYSYASPTLTLSGGSVSPGGSVRVTVSLNKYFEDGEYAVSSLGTTVTGESSQASGPLLVGEMYLLYFIGVASAYRLPLAGIVVSLGLLELWLSTRKRTGSDELLSDRATVDTVYDVDGGNVRVVDDEIGEVHSRYDAHGRIIDSSFSEASGLEIETPDIDYRTGTDSDSTSRKMSGVDKFTNITMKRGVVEGLNTDEPSGDDSISLEGGVDKTTLMEEKHQQGPIEEKRLDEPKIAPGDAVEVYEIDKEYSAARAHVAGTDTQTPSTDITEHDDSDLPRLDDIDESDIESPLTESSDDVDSVIPELAIDEQDMIPKPITKLPKEKNIRIPSLLPRSRWSLYSHDSSEKINYIPSVPDKSGTPIQQGEGLNGFSFLTKSSLDRANISSLRLSVELPSFSEGIVDELVFESIVKTDKTQEFESIIPDLASASGEVNATSSSGMNELDRPSPETSVHGELRGNALLFTIPFIIGSNTDWDDPLVTNTSYDLGLSDTDLGKLGAFRIDFDTDPSEIVLDDITITPLISGESVIELGDPPLIRSKIDFDSRENETKLPFPFKHDPVNPSLGQLINSEVSSDGKVNAYYRVYYSPIPQYSGRVSLIDMQGNLILPFEEGGMKIKFDPSFGVPPMSEIPFNFDMRISELFKIQEKPGPPETLILLDVKISNSDE